MTETEKILMVETKGGYLKNDESKEKAEIGAVWAAKASQLGRIYKNFMVYETKKPEYAGAYSHERFMEIVRGLYVYSVGIILVELSIQWANGKNCVIFWTMNGMIGKLGWII